MPERRRAHLAGTRGGDPGRLAAIVERFGLLVVDCRSLPTDGPRPWRLAALERRLDGSFRWAPALGEIAVLSTAVLTPENRRDWHRWMTDALVGWREDGRDVVLVAAGSVEGGQLPALAALLRRASFVVGQLDLDAADRPEAAVPFAEPAW